MVSIDVKPTSGTIFAITAFVEGKLAFLAMNGNDGQWSGAAQTIHIAASGSSPATYACTVSGTKTDGTTIAHSHIHTLSSNGHFSETL